MKITLAIVFYVNIMAITLVICNRECGPPVSISTNTDQWSIQQSCKRDLIFKGLWWPIYWLYRGWDRVL